MTREERADAIDNIQSILDRYEEDECLVCEITIGDEDIKALKMAIEVLKQEPILEKIRAEMHANAEYHDDGDCYLRDEWIDEIFDKYKAERSE